MERLREIIRRMIKESLIQEALRFNELEDTLLLKCKVDQMVYYLLLDSRCTQVIDRLFEKLKEVPDGDKTDQIVSNIMSDHRYLVLGMVAVRDVRGPLGSTEINLFAATEGWGPTLHDIVMGESDGIVADRRSVTQDAYDVYKFYHDNRQDVQKTPLDSIHHKWTPDTDDDTEWGGGAMFSDGSFQSVDDKSITQQKFNSDPLNWVYSRGPVLQAQKAYNNARALLVVFEKWNGKRSKHVLDYFTKKLALKYFGSKY